MLNKFSLRDAHPFVFGVYGGAAAFAAYFSMYAFRKPFAASTYVDVEGWSGVVDFKIALVLAQLVGYALSKLIGIKIISEMVASQRAVWLLSLVFASWVALVFFAIVPPGLKLAAIFLNGLPLGLIWGLVFGYLEGRRTTEILTAILCASLIVSSGVVKSVGAWLLFEIGVSEFWMPAAAGGLFFPLLFVSVLGLSRLPPPSPEDVAERTERRPMQPNDRAAFIRRNGPGVAFLILAYVLFTVFRDFRDNFAAEIWSELGYGGVASVFALTELPIAVLTLSALASIVLIKNNRHAVITLFGVIGMGAVLIGMSTFAFQNGWMSPIVWMVTSGAGLYFAYTPFNAMLFDRILAATREIGTAGFLIYLADASGYAGTVALLLFKNFAQPALDWVSFFSALAYCVSAMSVGFVGLASFQVLKRTKPAVRHLD